MESNLGHWKYSGGEFDVDDYFGFIYIITNKITMKRYLGRKFFHVHQKRKRVKQSNWRSYTGSCKPLNEDISEFGKDNFDFSIFKLYSTRGGLSYYETYYLSLNDVLTLRDDNNERCWYNNHIGAVKWIAPFEHSESSRYKISESKKDKEMYSFINKDGRVHHGSRHSLMDVDTAVNRRGLSKVITGVRKRHMGWSLIN